MKSVAYLYTFSILCTVSFLYAIVAKDWLGVFIGLIAIFLIGIWFMLQLKGDMRGEQS